jgi:hypothetical protein
LKDETDCGTDLLETHFVTDVYPLAIDLDEAMLCTVNAVEMHHQRGLSGSIRPQERKSFSRCNLEIDAEERLMTIGIGKCQLIDE